MRLQHPEVVIRIGAQGDLADVFAIEQKVQPAPWDLEGFKVEWSRQNSLCLVAFLDDVLVGYAVFRWAFGEADLLTVGVLPEYQRRGLARGLLERAREMLEKREAKKIQLEVRESNLKAQAFYRSLGFEEFGRRPKFYSNGETALLMALQI